MGISIRSQNGTLRLVDDLLLAVADRFQKMENATVKAAVAQDLFGRGGKELILLLNQGSEGIQRFIEQNRRLGAEISENTARQAELFHDNLNALKTALFGVSNVIAHELLPRLNQFTDRIVAFAERGGLVKLARQLQDIAQWMKNIGIWIVTFAVVSRLGGVAVAMRGVTLAAVGMNLALLANPWGLAAIGIASFGVVLSLEKRKIDAMNSALRETNKQAAIFAAARQGKNLEQLLGAGFSEEEIRRALGSKRNIAGTLPEFSPEGFIRQAVPSGEDAALRQLRDRLRKNIAEGRHLLEFMTARRDLAEQSIKNLTEFLQKILDRDIEIQRIAKERQQREIALLRQRREFQMDVAGFQRDAQLRQLALQDTQTIAQKVALEQRKAEIEVAHSRNVHEIKMKLIALEADAERRNILQLHQSVETRAGMDAARENAAIRQTQIIRDEQRRIFDSLKRQAEGVFDALLVRSRSVFGAIGDAFKTAMLTAIKEVITSRVAGLLMQMFSGTRVSFAGGRGGFGGVPVFGAASLAGFGFPGAPGGKTGFTGPVQLARGGGGGGALGVGAGVAGFLPGLKGFLGLGGNVAAGGIGPTLPFGALSLGGKLSAIGSSSAAALGGGALALAGLQRGGLSGLGMTTAGGALLGFKFGGPLGAAIGAGIGFGAGLIRLFIKGAAEKAREKIKALYGVDIPDKGILQQIVQIARAAFGSNLDMAIRSTEVRNLVELYAMSTVQSTAGLPAGIRPLSLVQSGGSIFQQPGFLNGSSQPSIGLDRIGSGRAASAGAQEIHIRQEIPVSIDGKVIETTILETIIRHGRVVQSSVMEGLKGNAGRRELTALQLSPGTLTS